GHVASADDGASGRGTPGYGSGRGWFEVTEVSRPSRRLRQAEPKSLVPALSDSVRLRGPVPVRPRRNHRTERGDRLQLGVHLRIELRLMIPSGVRLGLGALVERADAVLLGEQVGLE